MKKFLALSLALLLLLVSCSAPESFPEENSSGISESLPEAEAEPVLGKIQYLIEPPAENTELAEAFDSLEDFVSNQIFAYIIDFDLDGEMTEEQKLYLTYAAVYETDDLDRDEISEAVLNYPVKEEFGIDPESQESVYYKSAADVAESYFELFGEDDILHGIGDFVRQSAHYSPENGGWYFESFLTDFPSFLYPEIISYSETEGGFEFEFVCAAYDNLTKKNFDFLWFWSNDGRTYLTAENAGELLFE